MGGQWKPWRNAGLASVSVTLVAQSCPETVPSACEMPCGHANLWDVLTHVSVPPLGMQPGRG
jgi:hypothetical protein